MLILSLPKQVQGVTFFTVNSSQSHRHQIAATENRLTMLLDAMIEMHSRQIFADRLVVDFSYFRLALFVKH